jgi:thiol-disulfide isomerase/thioredoxin
MVRILLSIIILIFSSILSGQSQSENRCLPVNHQLSENPLIRQANDFTIITTDGITRNLYTTLDSGKTVFVDLFYTTCSYCQYYAPIIEEIYQNTGAGQEDIEFWGISNNLFDTNNVIDRYKLDYNITNPCAGPWGDGNTAFSIIVAGQNFQGFPTYCVICPDRTLFFDACYPPDDSCFNPYFDTCASTIGIQDHPAVNPGPGILSVYPNPSIDGFSLEITAKTSQPFMIEIFDLLGVKVFTSSYEIKSEIQTIFITADKLPEGVYFVRMLQGGLFIDSHKILVSRP